MANNNTNQSFRLSGTIAFSNVVNPQYWDDNEKRYKTADLKKNPDQIYRQGLQYAVTIDNPQFVNVDAQNPAVQARLNAIKTRFRQNANGQVSFRAAIGMFNQKEMSKPIEQRVENVIYYADDKLRKRITTKAFGKEVGRGQQVIIGIDSYESDANNVKAYGGVAIRLRFVELADMETTSFYEGGEGVPSELSGYSEVSSMDSIVKAPEESNATISSNNQPQPAQNSTSNVANTGNATQAASRVNGQNTFGNNVQNSNPVPNQNPFVENANDPVPNQNPFAENANDPVPNQNPFGNSNVNNGNSPF